MLSRSSGRIALCSAAAVLASSVGQAQSVRTRPFDLGTSSQIASAYGIVTSTLRTPSHNRTVGGVPNSYHLAGRAIDVARRPGVPHSALETALVRAGYALIESIDEGDHSHFAFAAQRPVVRPPIRAAAAITGASTSAPPVSEKPAAPRLAADFHGELLIDLVADEDVANTAPPRPGLRLAGAGTNVEQSRQ